MNKVSADAVTPTTAVSSGITLECKIHLENGHRAGKRIREGSSLAKPSVLPGRVPRISRLMALALRFEELVRSGEVRDYADLGRLGHVSRARVTQIMNLLNMAPDIQEEILFLPKTQGKRDPIVERDLRSISPVVDWKEQRRMWKEVVHQPADQS